MIWSYVICLVDNWHNKNIFEIIHRQGQSVKVKGKIEEN